jgi:TfoX/Sxy family transcriptional regulator of competence genes
MATKADFIEYLREQLAGAGAVSFRRMFGEYAVYLDERVVALVCDNQLFVKPTAGGRAFLGSATEAPPYPGASMYFLVDEVLESAQDVAQLIRITARELPAPQPKAGARSKPHSKPKPKPKLKPKPKPKSVSRAKSKAKPR